MKDFALLFPKKALLIKLISFLVIIHGTSPWLNLVLAQAQANEGLPLRVGIKEAAPFSFKNEEGRWQGISVSLWESIANDLELNYSYEELSLEDILKGLETASLDFAVGALTITATRESRFDFSHSFYNTGLGVATRNETSSGFIATLSHIFKGDFLTILIAIFTALILATIFITVFEKQHVRHKPENSAKARDKIKESLWWTLVIMIGKNDSHPVSTGGRILALIWMGASLFIVSSLTAVITSALTVNELQGTIESLEDLRRTRVVSLASSSSGEFLLNNRISFIQAENLEHAFELVVNNQADAVLYDRPLLQYTLNERFSEELMISKLVFAPQSYGLATPQDSEWLEPINQRLLERIDVDSWQDLLFTYLGE